MTQINESAFMEWDPLLDATLTSSLEHSLSDPSDCFSDLILDPNNLYGFNEAEISFGNSYDPIGGASFPYDFDLASDGLATINGQNVSNSLPNSSFESYAASSLPSLTNLCDAGPGNTHFEDLGDSANNVLVGGSYLDGPAPGNHWQSMSATTTYPIDNERSGVLSMVRSLTR
jgi:hypothetical protein